MTPEQKEELKQGQELDKAVLNMLHTTRYLQLAVPILGLIFLVVFLFLI